jgi:hypothetical protein
MSTKGGGEGQMLPLIAAALPGRFNEAQRNMVAARVAERVERWLESASQVDVYREQLKELKQIADSLAIALQKTGATLSRDFNIEKQIKGIKDRNASLGIQPDSFGGQPLAGRSASVDLYLIPWGAIDRLARWNKLYRPSTGRPESFAVELVRAVKDEYDINCAALDIWSAQPADKQNEPLNVDLLRTFANKNHRRYGAEVGKILSAIQKCPGMPYGLSGRLPAVRARKRKSNVKKSPR